MQVTKETFVHLIPVLLASLHTLELVVGGDFCCLLYIIAFVLRLASTSLPLHSRLIDAILALVSLSLTSHL